MALKIISQKIFLPCTVKTSEKSFDQSSIYKNIFTYFEMIFCTCALKSMFMVVKTIWFKKVFLISDFCRDRLQPVSSQIHPYRTDGEAPHS